MARIENPKSAGCLLQAVGLVSLITAAATFWTVIGPMLFGLTGLWLLIYGGMKARQYSCSECGARLSGKKPQTCPGCGSLFF
jgi:hypothetical protein